MQLLLRCDHRSGPYSRRLACVLYFYYSVSWSYDADLCMLGRVRKIYTAVRLLFTPCCGALQSDCFVQPLISV